MSADHQKFEVRLTHLDGHVRAKLRGELDHEATTNHANVLQAVADLRTRVVFDLSELAFIDSAGIGFLVRIAQLHDGPVRLINAPASVSRALAISGLAEVFDFTFE